MAKEIRHTAASVRGRLLNLSRENGQPLALLLTRKRLLYRLTQTEYRERFVLKGAMLLATWLDDPVRPMETQPSSISRAPLYLSAWSSRLETAWAMSSRLPKQ